MTDQNLSLIATVMDRSGSMGHIRQQTIDGFNEFIKGQRELPGAAVIYYTHFDHEYEIVHAYKPLGEFPLLTTDTYEPRGNTALLDAVGRTIATVGADLAAKPEHERPGHVIFVIQTDGLENSSREYTLERVREMIVTQRNQFGWTFLFLGATEEAMKSGSGLGIAGGQSLHYAGASSQQAFASVSASVGHTRMTGQTREFTDQERSESKPQ